MDELWGPKEISEHTGLTVETVYVYKSNGKLPPPDTRISSHDFWLPETIRQWNETRGRRGDS